MSSNFTLKANLCYALREQSGLEQHRPYLGMSGIAQCPRKLYYEFLGGRKPPTDQQHWYCWTGYMHEAAVVRLIAGDAEARQADAELCVLFLLIDQATLEPATLARDFARIQDQPLVFGVANRNRSELR